MYYLPTSIVLIGYSILTLIYIFKNKKVKIENHLFTNEILIALLFLIAGVLFPFMYHFIFIVNLFFLGKEKGWKLILRIDFFTIRL